MKHKWTIFGLVIIVIIFILKVLNSNNSSEYPIQSNDNQESKQIYKPSNPYLSKYAGGYTVNILVGSTSNVAEVYVLYESGNAKWMWLEDDGYGGAKKVSEKTGSWTAEKNKISISIQGKIGTINEDYIFKDGRFVNADPALSNRFLKRTK